MVKQKIKNILASVLEVPVKEIHDDASQKNLSIWDSLQHLNLIVELEESFNLEFEPEEIGDMNSLEKIEKIINLRTHTN